MKTYTSTSGHFKAEVQIDEDSNDTYPVGYLKSNTQIKLSLLDLTAGIYGYNIRGTYEPAGGGTIENFNELTYTSSPDGSLMVSLRKYLDITGLGGTLNLQIRLVQAGSVIDQLFIMYVFVVDGVSYMDIIAPRNNGFEEFTQYNGAQHNVVLPNVILVRQFAPPVIAEVSLNNITIPSASMPDSAWTYDAAMQSSMMLSGLRNNELTLDYAHPTFYYTEGVKSQNPTQRRFQLDYADNCTELVMVAWTSQTGARRQHLFVLSELMLNADESTQLIAEHDGYKVVKNVSNGLKIRLDGLTPYSYWYYADMIMASDLKVGVAPLWTSGFQDAYCIDNNKSVAQYQKGLMTFEATIKYKHYDSY